MEKLVDALWHYTSPTSNMYDKEFSEMLPAWGVLKAKKVIIEKREPLKVIKPTVLGVELDTVWPVVRLCDLDGSMLNSCWAMFKDGNQGPKKYKLRAMLATVNYTLSNDNILGKMPLHWERDNAQKLWSK